MYYEIIFLFTINKQNKTNSYFPFRYSVLTSFYLNLHSYLHTTIFLFISRQKYIPTWMTTKFKEISSPLYRHFIVRHNKAYLFVSWVFSLFVWKLTWSKQFVFSRFIYRNTTWLHISIDGCCLTYSISLCFNNWCSRIQLGN